MDEPKYVSSDMTLIQQVEHAVSQLTISVSDNLKVVPYDSATLAVVQLELKLYDTVAQFVNDINDLVSDAVNRRAHMICFPALTSWLALPFSPRFHRLLPSLQQHLAGGAINPHVVADILSACSADMMDVYTATMSLLAQQHGIYIMAGSALYYEMHQVYHRAFLFDNFGVTAGVQDKILPSFLETLFRIEGAKEIKLFETPFGKLSMLLTTDVNTFEPVRIAKNLGADMVICPDLFIGNFSPMDSSDGMNLRVMENNIYGVQSTLVGNTGLGFHLSKQASVYAPPAISYASGTASILCKSGTREGTRLFMAPLDLELLRLKKNPFHQAKNTAFLAEYFNRL